MDDKKTDDSIKSFWSFATKAVFIALILGITIETLLPDFSKIEADIKTTLSKQINRLKDERSKLYVLSFVQNPAALYKTSELAESDGKYESAIRDMDLAIGLLEMHGADKQVIRRYYDRVEKLKTLAKK